MDANVVADKIKYYRKKLNLSQEDLGQKLFVSKQTISLWEKGQTVPTVDNLIRLKEIFGVTIDEIIGSEIEKETEEKEEFPEGREEYSSWYYTDGELLEFKKHRIQPLAGLIIFISLITVASLLFSLFRDSSKGFFLGLFFMFVIFVAALIIVAFKNKAIIKKNVKELKSRSYKVIVYDDYFFCEIKEHNEITSRGKIKFSDITLIEDTEKLLIVNFDTRCLPLRKECLKKDSVFYSLQKDLIEKKKLKPPVKLWKVFSIILLTLSIFSVFVADGLYTSNLGADPKYLWVFYIFFALPIASFVYGFVLKSKGYKYKKNIIVAVIMIPVFVAVGGINDFSYDKYVDNSYGYLHGLVEEMTSIELPEFSYDISKTWDEESEVIPDKEYVYETSDLFFNQKDVDEFEKNIKKDKHWLTEIPKKLQPMMTSIADPDAYDYVFVYSLSTWEFNTKIKMTDTVEECHNFIAGFYNSKTNQMKLVDYSLFVE